MEEVKLWHFPIAYCIPRKTISLAMLFGHSFNACKGQIGAVTNSIPVIDCGFGAHEFSGAGSLSLSTSIPQCQSSIISSFNNSLEAKN